MTLTPAMKDFILHWGEMGNRWGVNRSVSQVHALLHLSPDPLPADAICELLGMARSNVSTAIKELQSWGIVRVSRQLGDRRDHFASERDLFELVRILVEARRDREFAPTMNAVSDAIECAKHDNETPRDVRARMEETLEVMSMFDTWYQQMARLPHGTQVKMLKLGARIAKYLPGSSG
ncbi:MAG: MarR family transcriptional regulator [Pseudomonadota bacterium]